MLHHGGVTSECLCAYAFAQPSILPEITPSDFKLLLDFDDVGGVYTGVPISIQWNWEKYVAGSYIDDNSGAGALGDGVQEILNEPLLQDATFVINSVINFDDNTLAISAFLVELRASGEICFMSPVSEDSFIEYSCPNLSYSLFPTNTCGRTADIQMIQIEQSPDSADSFVVLSTSYEGTIPLNPTAIEGFGSSVFFGGALFSIDLSEWTDIPSDFEAWNQVFLASIAYGCDQSANCYCDWFFASAYDSFFFIQNPSGGLSFSIEASGSNIGGESMPTQLQYTIQEWIGGSFSNGFSGGANIGDVNPIIDFFNLDATYVIFVEYFNASGAACQVSSILQWRNGSMIPFTIVAPSISFASIQCDTISIDVGLKELGGYSYDPIWLNSQYAQVGSGYSLSDYQIPFNPFDDGAGVGFTPQLDVAEWPDLPFNYPSSELGSIFIQPAPCVD